MRIGGIGRSSSGRARDLLKAHGSVGVEAAALGGADGEQLGGDDGARAGSATPARARRRAALAALARSPPMTVTLGVALARRVEHLAHARRRPARTAAIAEHREAGLEHRDRAVQEVGGRRRLGGDAARAP